MFDERYLSKEYAFTILIFFFHANKHGNKETNRKSFDVKCDNSQGIQKMIKKWEEPGFLKNFFIGFMNFLIINIERFTGINVVNALTETYFFTSSFILQVVNICVLYF